MNQSDLIQTIRTHQPITSRALYEPLLELGYYATKTETEAVEDIAKWCCRLKEKGILIAESKRPNDKHRAVNFWTIADIYEEPMSLEETNTTPAKQKPMIKPMGYMVSVDDATWYITQEDDLIKFSQPPTVKAWPHIKQAVDSLLK